MTGRPILTLKRPSKRFHKRPTSADLLNTLARAYPTLFEAPVPLAKGIDVHIRQDGTMSRTQARKALYKWTNRREYQEALAAGGRRYGLYGNPYGDVTDAEKDKARAWLDAQDA